VPASQAEAAAANLPDPADLRGGEWTPWSWTQRLLSPIVEEANAPSICATPAPFWAGVVAFRLQRGTKQCGALQRVGKWPKHQVEAGPGGPAGEGEHDHD